MIAANLNAYFDSHRGPEAPSYAALTIRIEGMSPAQAMTIAEGIAAEFPKYAKAKACNVGRHPADGGDYASVNVTVMLATNGVNGGANETGLKRLKAAEKTLAKLGIEATYGDPRGYKPAINLYPTRADFDAAVA